MSLKKYRSIFIISLADAFAYRANTVVWILIIFFWIGVYPFIWLTAYGDRPALEHITREGIVTYFFLVPLIEVFVISWLNEDITEEIKGGNIAGALMRPVNYLFMKIVSERSWLALRFVFTIPLMLLVYPFVAKYIDLSFSLTNILLSIPAILLGMILSIEIAILIGLIAFFTLKTDWIDNIWWMTRNVAAGYLAPLAFFPDWVEKTLSFTPFPLLLQTPILALTGDIERFDLMSQLAIGIGWSLFLGSAVYFLWRIGLTRLEAVGR